MAGVPLTRSGRSTFGRGAAIAVTTVLVLLAAACGSSSKNGTAAIGGGVTTTTLPPYIPVVDPSTSAQMVCGTEGQASIAAVLNETPTHVTKPTWLDHVYSCDYVYKTGTMGIAVKELSTAAQTTAYFNSLKKTYGLKETFDLGQGAFISPHGVVIARKDYKVLIVDPTRLPAQFGQPPAPRSSISIQAAGALMGCWTGA